MTARGVVLPLAVVAFGLAACAEQQSPTAAQPQPPAAGESTAPVRTASAEDPDAQAREEGFASAAEQARARAYAEPSEPPAEVEQPERR